MGEFAEELDCFKHSLSFLESEPNLEQLSHLAKLNGTVVENPLIGMMGYYNDYCMPQHPEFSVSDIDVFSSFWPVECQIPILMPKIDAESAGQQSHGGRKRKTITATNTNYGDSSGLHSEVEQAGVEIKKKNLQHSRDSKGGKSNSKELGKPIEVDHVRARRGQATDRHSLAERERRKKISDRMRRLQDQVPGCYKAMGMARMLDEIISYVQSLQNQVEFLSMQLSVARHFKDYNLRSETLGTAQADKTAHEVREEETLVTEGYGNSTSLYSSVPF